MPNSYPISEISKWPVPNQYKGVLINAFVAWTVSLDLLFVVLRIITRKWIVRARLWWDDYFILAAMVGTSIGASLDACEVHYGFGRHEKYITEHDLNMFGVYTYCEWIQTFFTLMCTKVSICYFLLRIPTSRSFIRPLQLSIAVLIISNIILTFIWIFQCWPVALAWDATVNGKCFGRQFLLNVILAQAVISVVSDLTLALCPIIILRKVRMRQRQKIGLCLLMGLGIIVGICCVIRTALNGGALPTDATFGGITNWFWRLFEVQLGIICACIPPLIPAYKWAKQKLTSSWHGSGTTLTSANQGPPAGMIADPTRESPEHQQHRSRNLDSGMSRSEKALLGQALKGKDLDPDGVGYDKGYDSVERVEDVDHRASLRTFFHNDTDEELGAITTPDPVARPTAASSRRSRIVSFSRRDLRAQGPLSARVAGTDLPRVVVTPPGASTPRYEPQTVGSPRPQPMVRETGNPKQSLDFVDLQPRQFERNRGVFARVLDLKRSSWMSWVSASSMRSTASHGVSGSETVV